MWYCTYCYFYNSLTIGTREGIVKHAYKHPIGSPEDMADLVANKDEFKFEIP